MLRKDLEKKEWERERMEQQKSVKFVPHLFMFPNIEFPPRSIVLAGAHLLPIQKIPKKQEMLVRSWLGLESALQEYTIKLLLMAKELENTGMSCNVISEENLKHGSMCII
jgi:hypothetical protein